MSIKTDNVEFLVTQEDFIELMDQNQKLTEEVARLEQLLEEKELTGHDLLRQRLANDS